MSAPATIDLSIVEELASRGVDTREKIADVLGISRQTLYNREKAGLDVTGAIERGKSRGLNLAASALFEQIGKGNLGAMIFYLKAKHGWSETQKSEITLTRTIEDLSDAELMALAGNAKAGNGHTGGKGGTETQGG